MMSAIRSLLTNLVDYAGLFPPASLAVIPVTENYHHYLAGNYSWMLGRIIIPAAKLAELANAYAALYGDTDSHDKWQVSALIPNIDDDRQAFDVALRDIHEFNERVDFATVDTVEGKISNPSQVAGTLQSIPQGMTAFLEINFRNPDESLEALAQFDRPNSNAKIRTGSVVAEQIPDSQQVANFLCCCAQRELPLKFTAGLHHPWRATYPLTYEPDSPSGTMHGFLNVFMAATLAHGAPANAADVEQILQWTDPSTVSINEDSIVWGSWQFSSLEIERTRRQFALSFGSCSFDEPIADLIKLGWLESAAKTV